MTDAVFQPKGLTPTAEQRTIQLERHRHVVVEANAGAAKTTTLALRLAQALARGANLDHIQTLTYTDAAVASLRLALDRIGIPAAVRNRLRIQTFDQFCAERLASIEGPGVTRYNAPEQLKPHLLQAIDRVLSNEDERHRDEFAIEGSGEGAVEGLLASFARLKGTMQLTLEAADRPLTPALADELGHDYLTLRTFWAYEHLRRGGHPDRHAFRAPDDATHDLAKLLMTEDALLEGEHPLALGLHLILLDEMHDTNRAMFTVLQHLLAENPAAFIGFGDRDQVIHAMAGADASFMGSGFDREIGVAQRLPLTSSYRFGRTLARHVGRLAVKDYLSQSLHDTPVSIVRYEHLKEAHWHIAKVITEREGLGPKSHLSEIAVLLRQPHQSVELENHLLDKGVDYRTTGFLPYLMRPEVLFVRGLIAHAREDFAAIEDLDTRVSILQALLLFCGSFVETEETDPGKQQQAEKAALKDVASRPEGAPLFVQNQVLRNAPPHIRGLVYAALDVLRANATDILIERFVQALMPQQLAARVMVRTDDIAQVSANIQGLIQSAATFDNVESFFRAMNAREVRQKAMRSKQCVVLSSIEAAKGLEFEHVIMPGLNKGEFAVGGNTADNRNLLYVGMTRAKHRLTILYDGARPSKYLVDAGLI
ncbi:MAG: ATP-dependent helicase [Aquabacterium sp.]|uniref:3'-5' exonuclease n=1 Tax=Aquabacterium sp. TaxID=1872578 RepID=UPI00271EEBBF|nr:ATP-dependent helicase [Aquabacterium sp.]MDO9004745.1 ATP-dependent helicase [Aquabacterium sp.]